MKDYRQYKKNFQLNVLTVSVLLFILTIIIGFLTSCSKYQVVSEVRVNIYHLQNPKTKAVKVLITKDSLVIGNYYRLHEINILPDTILNPK